jgi:hypothetical protein
MQGSFLLTLLFFLIMVMIVTGTMLFVFGLIFRKKKLWITGLTLFSLAVITLICVFTVSALTR